MQNIQRILSSIQLEQVCRYLADTGWQQSLNGARVDFEKPEGSGQEPCRVFLPASSTHPRFRQLLPNLVFSVSVVEDREPIQIALAMANLRIPPPVSASPASPAPTQQSLCRLRNSSAEDVTVQLSDGAEHYRLAAGEELLVIATAASGPTIDLLTAAAMRIQNGKLMHALPSQADRSTPSSLYHWLQQWSDTQIESSAENSTVVKEQSESLLAQFCFVIDGLEDLESQPAALLRATAILLCGFSQLMRDETESDRELFQLARQLLSHGQLTLPYKLPQSVGLWHVARSDCRHAPRKTLAWLTDEAVPVKS